MTSRSQGFKKPKINPEYSILADCLIDKPPYCCGTLALPIQQFTLFYGKSEEARRIELQNATPEQLDHLYQTCDPASFGLDHTDVLDESYRKAGKLDLEHFASKFDLEQSRLLNVIVPGLMEGPKQREIYAELYKLNVYGEGSFFKPHKDTPRAENIFGSLVIVFPTPHVGGVLVLREGDEEWIFDSGVEALAARQTNPSIAYIAFYSDIEHEVTPVTSGHRVTLTYNLYFADTTSKLPLPVSSNEVPVKAVLSNLLLDSNFLPNGGHLGFGLRYQYSIPTTTSKKHTFPLPTTSLGSLLDNLKGSDATLIRVCRELGLDASLRVVYASSLALIMLDAAPDLTTWGEVHSTTEVLTKYFGGNIIKQLKDNIDDQAPLDADVQWVTPMTKFSRFKTHFPVYGNEASLNTTYGDVMALVSIGPPGNRGKPPQITTSAGKPMRSWKGIYQQDDEETEEGDMK